LTLAFLFDFLNKKLIIEPFLVKKWAMPDGRIPGGKWEPLIGALSGNLYRRFQKIHSETYLLDRQFLPRYPM